MFDCNTFKDKRHLLILEAITLPSKQLQFCNFIMQLDQPKVGFICLFVYLGFYVAFNTVQVISRRVVGRAEETST